MGRRRDTWQWQKLDEERAVKGRLHPAWRGVGCLLVVLLGIGAFFFSGWFLNAGLVYIPMAARRPAFAPWLPDYFVVQLIISAIFMIASFTIVSWIYAVAFPIQPGEFDAPPVKRQPRKRR
jgi:hypothetical protein